MRRRKKEEDDGPASHSSRAVGGPSWAEYGRCPLIRRRSRPHSWKVLTLLLAGAIFVLTAFSVIDQLQHLSGAVPPSRDCPICAWAHGVIAGVKGFLVLLWCLLLLGFSAPETMRPHAFKFLLTTASRAPPPLPLILRVDDK
jgi:hypothetical protein